MSHVHKAEERSDRKIITTESEEWKNSYFVQQETIRARERRESMAEIADLIAQAWKSVGPMLEKNPDELMARLARRRNGMMNRPPRAWCAVLRANDTRITPMRAIIRPKDAMDNVCGPRSLKTHTVTVDAELVRWLCRPVVCDRPYNTVEELMEKLGWSPKHMWAARKKGVFEVRWISHLDGKKAPPVPVLHTHRLLDPGSRLGAHADVVWGTTIRYVCDHIPDHLRQDVKRVPMKGTVPLKKGGFSETFVGWRWICPSCGRRCRTIYYPLPPMALVELLKGGEIHRKDPGNPDAISPGNQTFACRECHGVSFYSRLDYKMWNDLVSHLSGGLLYGHEVRRPAWYEPRRKTKFAPRINRAPSRRRAQVRECMERGMKLVAIARRMRISTGTVNAHARKIYAQSHVKDLEEFRKRFGPGARKSRPAAVGGAANFGLGEKLAVI
jgi:hypothetical protein